ncbi:MAG: SDR family oxidoreductase [Chloroflexi bacterium]|nr:SDR family oxidoreductase [Chloroflexota bacterium]
MDLQLHGRRVLVTGASRGLGYAVAQVLAQEGARLAINARHADTLHAAAQRLRAATAAEVVPIVGDVSQADDAARVVREAAAALGGLDGLVTNAGGPPPGRFEEFDDATWYRAFDLAFLFHVRLIRAALPALRASDLGSVVAITSISAKQPIPNLVLSNTMRAAAVALIKSLALELGPEGLRFNAVLPGWTRTERVTELLAYRARQKGTTVDEELAAQARASALGRMAEPLELGRAVAFLLSPAASYLTGVLLPVEGGSYQGLC